MTEASTMLASRLLKIDSSTSESSAVDIACNAINNGELVVAPTETQYGILTRVDRMDALQKLFELKGRDKNKPISIFVKDITHLKHYAEMSPVSELLASKFLPGPLTLVLSSKKDFGSMITREGKTGFRLSANHLIQMILNKIEVPLTATSANFSGSPAKVSAIGINQSFGGEISVYLDSGILNNPSSTVVEVTEDKINVLREGAISEQDILAAIR